MGIIRRTGLADIINGCIIRSDGGKIVAARIKPINIELLSEKDQEALSNRLRGYLNGINYQWAIQKIERVVDLNGLISELERDEDYMTAIHKQVRYILRKQAADIVRSGSYKEPVFYCLIYGRKEEEIKKNLDDLCKRFRDCGIHTVEVLDDELMRLVNTALNPIEGSYNTDGIYNITQQMPIVVFGGK